ncbi:MAG TPA: sulfite exporter TauE/SafE family protein [Phnomibacter sp.]|nr:sulfite exporter TauE/SafE family protein [Phnomibacter sp.]
MLISAAVLGFAGSLHCVGMCGPIALSVPLAGSGANKSLGILIYFLGKTLTYAILGALFGLLGHQLALAGWQQALSLVLGSAMLLFALITIFKPSIFHSNALTLYIGNKLSPLIGKFLNQQRLSASFMLGMLNGLLPCGLVYIALSTAVASGSVWLSAGFMAVFGIATIPLMLMLVLFATQLSTVYRSRVRKWLPVFTAVIAVLLILRGLDLDIPYVSPHLNGLHETSRGAEAVHCD